jgi:hypothetical protein
MLFSHDDDAMPTSSTLTLKRISALKFWYPRLVKFPSLFG